MPAHLIRAVPVSTAIAILLALRSALLADHVVTILDALCAGVVAVLYKA
jgi:hypothetical protein